MLVRLLWIAPLILLAGIAAGIASAVVITTGDGTGNVTAPPDDPGFANVGRVGSTGVYLGNGWVLTANHVGANDIAFGGVLYQHVPESAVRLKTGAANSDVLLFRIQDPPALPALEIAKASPAYGEAVVMVGNGNNRAIDMTHWDAAWQEVTPPPPGEYQGWKQSSGRTVRWGTNVITLVHLEVTALGGTTNEFGVDFDDLADEGQAVAGDSGGAVFVERDGQWQLLGMMNFVQLFLNQPGSTEVFGNRTYAADLSYYRPQIMEIISAPVPAASAGGLAVLACALLGVGLAARRARARSVH